MKTLNSGTLNKKKTLNNAVTKSTLKPFKQYIKKLHVHVTGSALRLHSHLCPGHEQQKENPKEHMVTYLGSWTDHQVYLN